MKNENALLFFEGLSINNSDNPNCVKLAHNTDYSDTDAQFILKYVGADTKLLDLGSGTGLIINKIYNKVKHIDCVEAFKEFTKHIKTARNINIINKNIADFETNELYELITIFGLIQYFNEEESILIYKKCYNYLRQNGKIIIKNQFGIDNDVTVAGYSQEQKTDYFAQYRHVDKEINILKDIGFKNIEKIDIYPPEANRWNNTHFYAIVAEKN